MATKRATWIVQLGLMFVALFAQDALTQGTNATGSTIQSTTVDAAADSLIRSYSVDELLKYKTFYEDERVRLENERTELRLKGIADMEDFIETHPESNVLDKVIFRLAELHYEHAGEEYLLAQDNYSNLLDSLDLALSLIHISEPTRPC